MGTRARKTLTLAAGVALAASLAGCGGGSSSGGSDMQDVSMATIKDDGTNEENAALCMKLFGDPVPRIKKIFGKDVPDAKWSGVAAHRDHVGISCSTTKPIQLYLSTDKTWAGTEETVGQVGKISYGYERYQSYTDEQDKGLVEWAKEAASHLKE